MSMQSGQTGLMRMLIAALLLGAAGTSHAWSVLGCTFGPNVEAFISCVNNASSNAVNAAKDTDEGTIGHVPVEGGCASVKGIASSLYLMIGVPMIKQGMMASFHVAWEQTVNCAAQAIRAGYSPAGISTATCGPLGPLARRFPTGEELAAFVLPQTDASRSSLFAYQQAVRNLAQVSHGDAAAARR